MTEMGFPMILQLEPWCRYWGPSLTSQGGMSMEHGDSRAPQLIYQLCCALHGLAQARVAG
jgi:hypothetical protein